ncbi:unnamed protein product [Meganyctiphanes norvegica]|uniref:ubiquitinyl hydrolase 1 n=1 Tax=Meganyctiphanes norvegica TaxID=48144 RepID=A0AAV2PWQ9_MEGNR
MTDTIMKDAMTLVTMADATITQKLEFLDLDDLNGPDRQRLEDLFAADNPHVELLAQCEYVATGGRYVGISDIIPNTQPSELPCEVSREAGGQASQDMGTPITDLSNETEMAPEVAPHQTALEIDNAYEDDGKILDEKTDEISNSPTTPLSSSNSTLDNNTTPVPHSTESTTPNAETLIATQTAASNYTPPLPTNHISDTPAATPISNPCSNNNNISGVPVATAAPREYNVPPPHIPQIREAGSHGTPHVNHQPSTHMLQPTAAVYNPQQPYPPVAASPNTPPTVYNPHVLPPPPPHHQSPVTPTAAAPPYGQMSHQMIQAPAGPTVYVQNCHVNVSPYGATSVHNQNVHNQHGAVANVQNQQVHQHAVHNQYNVHQHIAAAAAAGGPAAAHNSQSPPVVPGQMMQPMAMMHDHSMQNMQHGMKPLHDKGDYDNSKQLQQHHQQQHQRFEQQTYHRGGYASGRGGRGRGRGGGRGGRGRGQPIPHHERSNSVSSDHSAYGSEKHYQETSPTPYTGMPQSQFVPNPYAHMYMPRSPYPPHPYGGAAGHMAAAASANVQGLPLIYHQQYQHQQQQQFLAHYQQSPHNQGQLVTYTPVSSQSNAGQAALHHSQQHQQHPVPTSHPAQQHSPSYHPSVQHHYPQQVPGAAAAAITMPEQHFQTPSVQPQPSQAPDMALVNSCPEDLEINKIPLVSEVPVSMDAASHDPVDNDETVSSNSETCETSEEVQIDTVSKDTLDLKPEGEFEHKSENISDNISFQSDISFQPANDQCSNNIDEVNVEMEKDSVNVELVTPTPAVSMKQSAAVIIVGTPMQDSLDMSNYSSGKIEFKNGSFSNTADLGLSFTVDDEIFPLNSNSLESSLNVDGGPPPVELPSAKPQVVLQTPHVAVEMPKTTIPTATATSLKDMIPAVEEIIKKSSSRSVSPIMIIPEPTKSVAPQVTKSIENSVVVRSPTEIPAPQLPTPAATAAAPTVNNIDKAPSGIGMLSSPAGAAGLGTQGSPALPLPQDDVAVPAPAPVGAWAQKKSWAQLFTKKQEEGAAKQVAYVAPFNQQEATASVAVASAAADIQQEKPIDDSSVASIPQSVSAGTNMTLAQDSSKIVLPPVAEEDIEKAKLGEMLRQYQQDHRHVALQPRGLINKGYWCYVNAPLQALLACPPFYNLMTSIPTISGLKKFKSATPVIDSIGEYVHEFSEMNQILKPSKKDKDPKGLRKEPEIVCGSPFEPLYVYKLLSTLSGELFTEGRQQDAEEMLSCVLNGLHDEMVEALKLAGEDFSSSGSGSGLNGDTSDHEEFSDNNNDDDDEWQVMGPKKRSVITRTAHFTPSPISNIFWGMMRSNLQQAGGQVTANLQPFTTVPLDIQSPNVETVRDALDQLVSREDVSGYTCSKTNQEVAVSKQVVFEHLPNVMILQLKRFIYDKDGGLQKVTKKVGFPLNLEITKELMSTHSRGKYSSTQRKFKLLAIVYHDGKEASKGHYVADIYHSGYNCWLRYDDSVVKVVAEQQMLKHIPPRVPYLLFYRRQDTMVGPTTKTKT